jgi:hypothetical protein
VGLAATAALLSETPAAAQSAKLACIDANESAQDFRRAGKLRAARGKLVECLAATCPGPVRQDCAARLAEIDAAMPTLVLEANDEAGHELTAVRVTVDGQLLADHLAGASFPVDPGEHTFTFDAAGRLTVTKVLVLHEGDKRRRETVTLIAGSPPAHEESPPSAPSPPPPPPPPPLALPGPAPNTEAVSAAPGQTQRWIGIGLGGAGVVALGIGSILGLVSKSTYDHALSTECTNGDSSRCTPSGQADGRTAHQQAGLATGLFAVGGAFLVTGAVVYFVAPRVAIAPTVGARDASISVGGVF